MMKKKKLPDNAFWISESCRRPMFGYGDVIKLPKPTKLFFAVAERMFPELDQKEYSFSDVRQLYRRMPDIEFYPRGTFATLHFGTAEQIKEMNELWVAMQQSFDYAYESGKTHGRDLLMGLASGYITTKQLNEATLKPD